jgi:hypothetical protein
MGSRPERRPPETEAYDIPRNFRDVFDADYPVVYLVPHIIGHYLRDQDQWVQQRLNQWLYRPTVLQYLITWIGENERLNSGALRGGKIRHDAQTLIVPTAVMFYRGALPHLRITTCRTGQVRIDPNLGVLTELGRLEELETIVWRNTNIDFFHLHTDSRERIVKALHTFRIYTATSIHDPHPGGVPNDNLEIISAAIRVFQLEAIRINPSITNFLERVNRTTLLGINQALVDGWRRDPFIEGIHENPPHASRYFIRRGVVPLTARYNQQARAWLGFPEGNWGGPTDFIPKTDQVPVEERGCAIALVANIAFTQDPRTTITPLTIIRDDDNFLPGGDIFWTRPLPRRWNITSDERRANTALPARLFNELMSDIAFQYYVAINVNYFNTTRPHWVGASELVRRGNTLFYRISPTSIQDFEMNQTPNSNRGTLGWQTAPNEQGQTDIFVPLTQIKGYRIFRMPQTQQGGQ